ncbi:MAG: sigma-54-dependent Fis family transcriptional regulator [Candidatus Omnitrophica bacterium]|nr:sigma-54-dependent Fis family transcriptional regulator [Candidatus Omnitrophota bacterium]MCB9783786.1 sigma-54-dependent Fis family transcriptional regulator [Candidatus Omnitrophota bacterium]
MMNTENRTMRIAVVDDDPEQRGLLRKALEEAGYEILEGGDGQEAIDLARTSNLDGMVLDVRMPGVDGLQALKTIKSEHPEVVVTLLTAFIDLRDAVAAMKTGASDYLEKPVDLDELTIAMDEALGVCRDETGDTDDEDLAIPRGVIAQSPSTLHAFRLAHRVAASDANILVYGESGTGKEIVARYIHEKSPRKEGPLVTLNCAAFPENLIESILFGHEKGSFTGADSRRQGSFEEASSGTLFLDEIGEMPLALQPKLLRVLEDRRIRRIGGTKDIEVDVRVIAATNRELEKEVEEGRFREDLYYRFNVIAIPLPPLRERREDILLLADRFIGEQGTGDKRFSPAAQRALLNHDWPGNVRELRNVSIRASLMSRGNLILPEDLPESLQSMADSPEPTGGSEKPESMEEIQKQAILKALEETGGNKTQAAQLLKISRRNLIYKLRSYGL